MNGNELCLLWVVSFWLRGPWKGCGLKVSGTDLASQAAAGDQSDS